MLTITSPGFYITSGFTVSGSGTFNSTNREVYREGEWWIEEGFFDSAPAILHKHGPNLSRSPYGLIETYSWPVCRKCREPVPRGVLDTYRMLYLESPSVFKGLKMFAASTFYNHFASSFNDFYVICTNVNTTTNTITFSSS
jgi:hypothetical protein